MIYKLIVFVSCFILPFTLWAQQPIINKWSLLLHQPNEPAVEVIAFENTTLPSIEGRKIINGISIEYHFKPVGKYSIFNVNAQSDKKNASVYFSLQCKYSSGIPYNFNGEVKSAEIYRQSPHDVNAWIVKNIAEQAIPVVAIRTSGTFTIAINSSPSDYDNFTSQYFYPEQQIAGIASGDNGETPGLKPDTAGQVKLDYNADKTQIFSPGKVLTHYHVLASGKPHNFKGILFKSSAANLNELRRDINYYSAVHFSGGKIDNYFGALAFTTAYMNLRVNETAKSKYWVVPSVEYSNTQYCRDAFWISTMLTPAMSKECLDSELQEVNTYAEYPLITVIWAYRAFVAGENPDRKKVQAYIDSIEQRARNGYFYSYTEKDGRLDFQYWGDVMAFEKDDVITYNQGLFVLALHAARKMGLRYVTNPELALKNYREMFNVEEGFFPISKKKKSVMGPDPLVPDLLSQLYFDTALLASDQVSAHYNRMVKFAKTNFGFKVLSLPDGKYLTPELYDIPGYTSQVNREKTEDGSYLRGGSFFLYDNLFLMDAYLHGITEAEDELIWRISLDFEIGATTYECLNTKTGEPWKPNMGWNVAVYSFWQKIVMMKTADDKLFKALDKIVKKE